MGSNNNKNQGYGPNANPSGTDPKGVGQNQSQYQQQRFENQQGPMVQSFAQNYGQGAEQNLGDYTNLMNQYNAISGNPGAGMEGYGSVGGGGMPLFEGQYQGWDPSEISYTDPFNSYAGYQEFSKTGGYSPEDINNMRSRGISPIRAAYANAEREVGRQRSLQGGYSANAGALQARMAREQGQSSADAAQNVEAGLAIARNQGRLAGLGGMSNIESQRLGADLDVGKFNATGRMGSAASKSDAYNKTLAQRFQSEQADAGSRNSASSMNAQLASQRQMAALAGATNLYGTTPGLASTFGNQLLQGVGMGGNFGLGLYSNDIQNQRNPGQYEQTMGRVNDFVNAGAGVGNALMDYYGRRNQKQGQTIPDPGEGYGIYNSDPMGGQPPWMNYDPSQDYFG